MRWLCATLTKSRSWPLGSGIVLKGIGIGFQFLRLEFPSMKGFKELGFTLTESSKVENWRLGNVFMKLPDNRKLSISKCLKRPEIK